jgi:hypothetical protein
VKGFKNELLPLVAKNAACYCAIDARYMNIVENAWTDYLIRINKKLRRPLHFTGELIEEYK